LGIGNRRSINWQRRVYYGEPLSAEPHGELLKRLVLGYSDQGLAGAPALVHSGGSRAVRVEAAATLFKGLSVLSALSTRYHELLCWVLPCVWTGTSRQSLRALRSRSKLDCRLSRHGPSLSHHSLSRERRRLYHSAGSNAELARRFGFDCRCLGASAGVSARFEHERK
jgi:hypothetical protein